MTDKHKFIFSRSAAERILHLEPLSITDLQNVYPGQIKVTTKQKQEYHIGVNRFIEDFVTSRKLKAKKLKVETTKYSNLYRVINPENLNRYPVRTTTKGIECKCRDYQKQQEILGEGCCKHGFSVLNYLGYEKLSDYCKRQVTV